MPYCVKADLVKRFGSAKLAQLTDETAAHSTDDSEISDACDDASSLIDSFLAARYTLPLTSTPDLLRKLAIDIAWKFLLKDRAGADHPASLAYAAALAILRDIGRGVAGIPDADGLTPAATGGLAYATPTAVFDTTGLL